MTTLFSNAFKTKTLISLLSSSTNGDTFYYAWIFSGALPGTAEESAPGTLLHSGYASNGYQLNGRFSAPSNGVSTLAPTSPATIGVVGVPGCLGVVTATGQVLFFANVGVVGSGAGAILSSTGSTSVGVLQPTLNNLTLSWPETLGTVKLNTALRNALCSIWCKSAASINMANAGTIKIYSGSAPSSADAAATGTLLATFATSTSTWGTATGGAAALAATLSVSASATGTAGYARFSNSAGTYVIQGSVGTSGADFTMDSLTLTSGSNTSITNATIAL